jgi:predicted naringenin-chalcone synthase
MGRIISIGTAVPPFSAGQTDILDFMHAAYDNETASRKLRILFHSSGIDTRHSAVPDFDQNLKLNRLFPDKNIPGIVKRLAVYQENAVALAINAIHNSLQKINSDVESFGVTHLITVSCTGLQAPGIDSAIMEELSLPKDIFHTSVNFAGCNAAFPALKIADMITRTDENAKVLVVCVELCTLHFQPKNNPDNLLANTLFGDGAAAVLMLPEAEARRRHQKGLSIGGFYSTLLPDGKQLMGWNITPVNFEMILNAKVPAFIGEKINGFMIQAALNLDIDPANIHKWAVHPGGRKILDVVKEKMNLADEDLADSYQVLKDLGNISSPTILFILKRILEKSLRPEENVFALGFGPGISIEAILFSYAE